MVYVDAYIPLELDSRCMRWGHGGKTVRNDPTIRQADSSRQQTGGEYK